MTTPAEGKPTAEPVASASDHAAILAELNAMDAAQSGEPAPDEAAAAADEKADTEASDEAADEASDSDAAKDAETDEAEAEADETETDAEEKPEASPEPVDELRDKRIAAIKEEERAARTRVDAYIAGKEREIEQRWAERIKKAERWELLEQTAVHDPVALLEAAGYGEADFEAAARAVFAASPAGQKNPSLREQSAQRFRTRQQESKISATEKRLQELEAQIQQQETERHIAEYVGAAADAISDETPIVRSMLAKNPQKLRSALRAEVERTFRETGEVPDHGELVRHFEKVRRAELEELGVDVAALGKPTKPNGSSKKPNPEAGEKDAAKSMSNDITTKTKPRTEPKGKEEFDAETLRMLESGAYENY